MEFLLFNNVMLSLPIVNGRSSTDGPEICVTLANVTLTVLVRCLVHDILTPLGHVMELRDGSVVQLALMDRNWHVW